MPSKDRKLLGCYAQTFSVAWGPKGEIRTPGKQGLIIHTAWFVHGYYQKKLRGWLIMFPDGTANMYQRPDFEILRKASPEEIFTYGSHPKMKGLIDKLLASM